MHASFEMGRNKETTKIAAMPSLTQRRNASRLKVIYFYFAVWHANRQMPLLLSQ